jgi:hypothetical protein
VTTVARRLLVLFLAVALFGSFTAAQSASSSPSSSSQTSAVVPRLVNFSGKAVDGGNAVTGVAGATFAIYSEETGGSPLWLETQNIQADAKGGYTVQLGAIKPDGLPLDLFTSGGARWLGVTINSGQEQPRILLLSVPYALKAADAETVGGLPASAFVLAAPIATANSITGNDANTSGLANASTRTTSDVTTTGGTANTLSLFSTGTNIQNSSVTQTGSGTTGKIGIDTTTPATALDVNGSVTVRGTLTSTATGTATAAKGFNSQPQDFVASAFNSSTSAAVGQKFQWQAEPAGNDTASASGTMNLLYGAGTATPAETGLKISNKGLITFASGQTFPGGGSGTITGVKAGTGLTGGGTSGTVTLNLNTAQVPLLAASNTFTNINYFNASIAASVTQNSAIAASSSATGYNGLVGVETATSGGSNGVWGVTSDVSGAGVYGQSDAGLGVFGQKGSKSTAGQQYIEGAAGVWGDGGTDGAAGVIASADDNNAADFQNNSATGYATVVISTYSANTPPLQAFGTSADNYCQVDGKGDLTCTGSKNAVVPIDGGARVVAMAAIESPKNWFEDFGSAQLTNGAAIVALDRDFIQTVNTEMEYQVFLTPYGDCKGLYVSNRTASSFEVHELGGGSASLSFGYRITAIRKKYENVRFADHTHDMDSYKLMQQRKKALGAKPISHGPIQKQIVLPTKEALLPHAPVN